MSEPRAARRAPLIALAIGALAVLSLTLAQLLDRAPRQTGSNDQTPQQFSVTTQAAKGACQDGETLFAHTGELLMTVATFGAPTPRLQTTIERDGRVLARGELAAGAWREGKIRIPVAPAPAEAVAGVTVCVKAPGAGGRLALGGEPTAPEAAARIPRKRAAGRFAIDSFYGRDRSLLDLAATIGRRYDRGNAGWLGGWTLIVVALLALAAVGTAGVALARAPSARLVVATAVLAAAAWALLTPPFMVPDETAHVSYVQGLVETGELPLDRPDPPPYSAQENDLLAGLDFYDVIGSPSAKPAWTPAEGEAVKAAAASEGERRSFNASTASSNPPLYYLVEAPAYAVTRGASLLDQLLPLRLVSVLLGGLTALFCFLFLKELLPHRPEAWVPGALVAALQPVFGFISGGVNADAGLFAVSAATLWLAMLVLRRGLTLRRALALGGAVAAGMLTKPLFIGLVPAAVVAVAVAAWRGAERPRPALVAAGLGLPLVVVLAYNFLGDALSDHPYFPNGFAAPAIAVAGGGLSRPEGLAGLRAEAFYIWQVFLPRLPFMLERFPDPSLPLRYVWFNGLVGRFGWLDYGFPLWVTDVAVKVAFAVLALGAVALVRARALLRARWAETLVALLAIGGIAGAIGVQQYNTVFNGGPLLFQARYLLPLLALYGGLCGLAVSAFGRRAAPYLGVALVTIAATHELAALVLTLGRYYA